MLLSIWFLIAFRFYSGTRRYIISCTVLQWKSSWIAFFSTFLFVYYLLVYVYMRASPYSFIYLTVKLFVLLCTKLRVCMCKLVNISNSPQLMVNRIRFDRLTVLAQLYRNPILADLSLRERANHKVDSI